MEKNLTATDVRILGSLAEKEMTTPEYYPLTLNSLVLACNQKNNREPVMSLGEDDVAAALESLTAKHLAWRITITGARVPKYEHNLKSAYQLNDEQLAALCVLLLRGPQTAGEIRTRTERMHAFASLDDVTRVLHELRSRESGAIVKELPRAPGQKESRFVHLLSGDEAAMPESAPSVAGMARVTARPPLESRFATLEETVQVLQAELREIKETVARLAGLLE